MPPAHQLTNAEIQVLDCIDSNFSFASSNNDVKKFQHLFPNSKIAESYRQTEIKTEFVLQFGIVPLEKNMQKDFKDQPFTFRFDQSTMSQVKKQYAYLQFWYFLHQQIENLYRGSVFVGHCSSKELLNHFFSLEIRWIGTIDFFAYWNG